MRKAPFLAAAGAVALLTLVLPASSEARTRSGKKSWKRALPAAAESRRDPFTRTRAGADRGGRPSRTGEAPPPAARVIHQTDLGEVVIDSVAVTTAGGSSSEVPVPALEAHEYPPAPCAAEDPVIEAHVHVADEETPEKPQSEILPPKPEPSRMARLARRVSSLFRAKSAASRVRPRDVDLSELLAENFLIPVEGVDRARLRDSFLESRGQYARHLAIDIGAPRGTPILATADGEIVRLTRERRGGITIYQKDSSGRYLFFYCHLSRYGRGLRVGQTVSKGQVIGYVGATGRVIGGPHLHFSITLLPDDDNHREGMAINPYLIFLAGVQ